jgi:hypothetical protein
MELRVFAEAASVIKASLALSIRTRISAHSFTRRIRLNIIGLYFLQDDIAIFYLFAPLNVDLLQQTCVSGIRLRVCECSASEAACGCTASELKTCNREGRPPAAKPVEVEFVSGNVNALHLKQLVAAQPANVRRATEKKSA